MVLNAGRDFIPSHVDTPVDAVKKCSLDSSHLGKGHDPKERWVAQEAKDLIAVDPECKTSVNCETPIDVESVDEDEDAVVVRDGDLVVGQSCLLYTSPSPRDLSTSRMPSSA